MMTRRRFLTISAAFMGALSLPALAASHWRGRVFGADVSIDLRGGNAASRQALQAARDTLERLEKQFSIYDPGSALSILNRTGRLAMSPEFSRLIHEVDDVHSGTGGLFDPTIQPLFSAKAKSGGTLDVTQKKDLSHRIGWSNVEFDETEIRFRKPGMAMTLNGIAQGFATDRVTEILALYGFDNALVNIGEYRAGPDTAKLSIRNAQGEELASESVSDGAMATSSVDGYSFANGKGHILDPQEQGNGVWSTVSVIADTATVADGYSTALMLTQDMDLAWQRTCDGTLRQILLFGKDGDRRQI